ncbi:alpha/beta hydrolase [Herbiconiux moechotypicola]|uniref:Alpha/beta hydrolase fold domain-containing protein n=1 Tax=Herbiconiux moechotypicola TaxID=637393 RepID=A0ABP5QH11_9MICO|nr:alpha/beta hydrolase [Herbiconiux moechotypicola]MCS5730146.1 alpha/beta hydrolase [Herbiconiux moechotypicola]
MEIPEWAVVPLLRALRANRVFVTEEGARRRVRERELRPVSYGPPTRLAGDLEVSVSHRPWPVYTIAPRAGEAAPDAWGAVVYVHGGGWVGEVARQHWRLVAQLAVEARTAVVLPIYPLVPFGTAAEVVAGVVQLVRECGERFGPTVLAGDSAGGQIALSAAMALRDGTKPEPLVLPRTVLISPALDLTWSNPRIPLVQPSDPWLATPGGRVLAEHWRGDLDLRDPVVSPLAGRLEGLGPLTLFTGTRDVLNPDAHLLARRAAEAGVPLELHEGVGKVHVYPLLPTASGRAARAEIVRSIAGALSSA